MERIRQILTVETSIAHEATALIQRRPAYAKMVAGLYGISAFGLERSRVLRASYFPIRLVDDLLDGDARSHNNPLDYVHSLRDRIETNMLRGGDRIDDQLRYALESLVRTALATDDPRGDFVRAIDAIVFDYERAQSRQLLTEAEIESYYRAAFDPVINITLQAIGSKLRSADLPALSYGQGRVYSARDFPEDWTRGILNLPKEVLESTTLSKDSPIELAQQDPTVIDWFRQTLAMTRADLVITQATVNSSGERQTRTVCDGLIRPLIQFIDKHS